MAYAVTQFATKTNAVVYVDAAHGGWLGWEDNSKGFAALIRSLGVEQHLRGFATNVANYQPLGDVACPASVTSSETMLKHCSLAGKGTACCSNDPCGQHRSDLCDLLPLSLM